MNTWYHMHKKISVYEVKSHLTHLVNGHGRRHWTALLE